MGRRGWAGIAACSRRGNYKILPAQEGKIKLQSFKRRTLEVEGPSFERSISLPGTRHRDTTPAGNASYKSRNHVHLPKPWSRRTNLPRPRWLNAWIKNPPSAL